MAYYYTKDSDFNAETNLNEAIQYKNDIRNNYIQNTLKPAIINAAKNGNFSYTADKRLNDQLVINYLINRGFQIAENNTVCWGNPQPQPEPILEEPNFSEQ